MNDMPSQALAQLVETRASTFTAFRNGYGLREYSLKMIYRVHPRAKIASHDAMISFQHPGTGYQVLAAGTLLANKQVEQCVS